jgi:hypothetical protein
MRCGHCRVGDDIPFVLAFNFEHNAPLSDRYAGGYHKEKAHERMVAAGVAPNLLTWGCVMAGYYKPVDKENMVHRMIASGVLPNVHTMIVICLSYSEFTERIRVYRSMTTGAHAVKVTTTAVSKLFENAIFPTDTRVVLDIALGFSDNLLSSHITLGQLLPICADNDDSVLLRKFWWIGAARLSDSKLGWPGDRKDKFSVSGQIRSGWLHRDKRSNRIIIEGAAGVFGAKINGTYDRNFENESEIYIKSGDENIVIEHFEDKWRVKPLSAKGQGKCYAWITGGCPLQQCSLHEWTVLDGDVWSVAPSVKMKTGYAWALLGSLLQGQSEAQEAPRSKRQRVLNDAELKSTDVTHATGLVLNAPESPADMRAKSAKCAAYFSDFFNRVSQAKALNEKAMSMAFKELSYSASPAATPSAPEALERPHVDPFEPVLSSPIVCDIASSSSSDCHGVFYCIIIFFDTALLMTLLFQALA